MLTATLVGTEKLQSGLTRLGVDVKAAVRQGIARACLRILVRSKEKLSDDVLHVRTGRLRRSITTKMQGTDEEPEGIVGTNVEYAARHEYGFHGTEQVKAYVRRVPDRDMTSGGKSGTARRTAMGVAFVHSFTRNANTPERSFLRSALNELRPEVGREIEQALSRAIFGGGHGS